MSGAVCAAAPDWASLFIQDSSQLLQALTQCGLSTWAPVPCLLYSRTWVAGTGESVQPQPQPLHGPGPCVCPVLSAHRLRPYQGPGGPCGRVQDKRRHQNEAHRGMWGPGPWTHQFRVPIPASPVDLGQATSPDLSFLIWRMGLLKEPAGRVCCEVSGLRTPAVTAAGPGTYAVPVSPSQ